MQASFELILHELSWFEYAGNVQSWKIIVVHNRS